MARARFEIRPQPGPQERFLSSQADIAIFGGAAGGGKSFGLLLQPLRHVSNREFGCVIFRREATQILNEGGLWDTAMELYPRLGAKPRIAPKPTFVFPTGARVSFGHLNAEADVLNWQGAQIPLVEFDELTHFTKGQFFYMLSRNRSMSGVKPYVRATTNPDADSWIAEFISWWIDQETGLPIPERSGVLRWFVRLDDALHWADTPAELVRECGCDPADPKSTTFIAANVRDNQKLLERDPGYLANLKALSRVERERLLGGNWKVRPAAGMYFMRQDAVIIDARPTDVQRWVRAWDLAATEKSESNSNPDWTVGVLIGKRANGRCVIGDVIRVRRRASDVRELVHSTAKLDGTGVTIRLPEDPGQAGKDQAQGYVCALAGFPVFTRRVTGDKVTRAEPFAAQWQAHNIEVLRAEWNDALFAELEAFPESGHDDQVDAAAEGFAALVGTGGPSLVGSAAPRLGDDHFNGYPVPAGAADFFRGYIV